ncbi:MAG: glycosyltransferase family 9 protein [Flavobacteriaceae bacterium]|tara:strand:+ start:7409 stop:8470 length:1062 start_codon:yes stop_codon:yes gene_type:complete
MKILVIQQKMIGDVLLSTLICKNLKIWNPTIKIDFVANNHTLGVLENNPYIDNIIVFQDTFKNDKLGLIKFIKSFRNKRYDYVIDAYGKLESILITIFTPAKTKIGYSKFYTDWIYNKPIKRIKSSNQKLQLSILHRLQLLEPIIGDKLNSTDFEIHLTHKEEKEIAKKFDLILEGNKRPIMIAAMGSGKNKTYPIEYLAPLIDLAFETTNAPMILNYVPYQKTEIDKLIRMLKPKTKKAIQNGLTPNSLRDYIVTVSQCQAVIGNEGGAINIAKGLSKPTFAIFSPIIDPSGWHTEVKNKTMAVHLVDFFPDSIYFKKDIKIKKNEHIKALYLKLDPKLFKQKWVGFLQKLN